MSACDVVLFAAGLGTRLRPHTEKNPKPVIPLLSYPLGFYPLPYIQQLQINRFVVNTFHLPQQIHQLYKKTSLNPIFSDEKDFIKGSAGGLKQAEPYLKGSENILAVNADEVLFTEHMLFLKDAFEQHLKNKALATLIVKEHPGVGKEFGGIWCEGQTVSDIGKKIPDNPNLKGWHFIGFQFLSIEVLKLIELGKESNIFYDILINHLHSKRVHIYPVTGDWYETGNVQDYINAKKWISTKLSTDSRYKKFFQSINQFPKSDLPDLV